MSCRLQQANTPIIVWGVETANGSTNITSLSYASGYMTSDSVVDGVQFLVTLLSSSDDPRALSEMFIRNVRANLNGTKANCSTSFPRFFRLSTLISVIRNGK